MPYSQIMDKKLFGKAIRGFIRSHLDAKTTNFITDPDKWLAEKMGKEENTIRIYLGSPDLMSHDVRARMILVLREELLFEGRSVDLMVDLIDSIPERKS